jgi:hypothetical protein
MFPFISALLSAPGFRRFDIATERGKKNAANLKLA